LERAADSDVQELGHPRTTEGEAFAASHRLMVWRRCHTLLETIIRGQEAVNDFSEHRRNGDGLRDIAKHWGSEHYYQ
jgi:hypothetical protein